MLDAMFDAMCGGVCGRSSTPRGEPRFTAVEGGEGKATVAGEATPCRWRGDVHGWRGASRLSQVALRGEGEGEGEGEG